MQTPPLCVQFVQVIAEVMFVKFPLPYPLGALPIVAKFQFVPS